MPMQRLEPNRTAFQRLLPELSQTHENQFVAICQGRLVDADPDRVALVRRTRAQGYRPVYIQRVTREPRIVELPSPEEILHHFILTLDGKGLTFDLKDP